ncbi:M48 family metallopeptidase [Candidatus Bathyarchaeota archaeon A05DMB-2]|jgi:predicted metal-dependent hydrolase|nr:M48 family metallopeptidase [Candidatus Bathyarchaeota archaeon A05DMB-2]
MDELVEYTVAYRNVKHPRLEYKTGTLLLILPKGSKNEKQTLEKYQKWIHKKELTIKKALEQAKTKKLVSRTDKELRSLIHTLAQNYQTQLNTKINKIYFKKMKTKWASHSKNGNLTVNTLLKYLPPDLIEYIIYHETTHSVERKHNEKFWSIINKKFPDYQTKEKDLLTYWFTIQKNLVNLTSSKIRSNV